HQIHTRFTPDSHGRTRFYMDISRRCSLCAETLTATVNINHQTVSGETPLIAAARNGDVASTAWLLPQKADVELRNKQGNSALITAVQNDAIEVVRLLVNAGVNVSRKNKLGYSAIDIAEQKNKDILEVLRGRSLLDRF
ncbi:MAG: ankyrin repeat protein, partial [Lentisphaeria bacterium]